MRWLRNGPIFLGFGRVVRWLANRFELVADRRLVSGSALWDVIWYLEENPSVARKDALTHFVLEGGRCGKAPSRGFDSQWYISTYPDVAVSNKNPLVHYLRFGAKEGRQIKAGGPPSPTTLTEDYEIIRNSHLFDALWYLATYPDLAGVDLVAHYIEHGAREGRAASELFDTQWYCARYPDVNASGINPIIFHIRHGSGRDTRLPCQIRGMLNTSIDRWSEIEAGIRTERRFHPMSGLPINASIPSVTLYQAWARLYASFPPGIERIVVVPSLTRGGADYAAANVIKAAIQIHGVKSVLVIVTDEPKLGALDWLPQGTMVIVIPLIIGGLVQEERVRLVELTLFSLRPKAVFNVNSRACWDLFREKGRALSRISKLYSALFCEDFDENGLRVGYSDTHFVETIANLTEIYVDNSTFLSRLVAEYQLSDRYASKLVHLRQPYSPISRAAKAITSKQRLRVVWAGRLTKQKNIELLQRIIRQAPDIDFVIYGTGDEIAEKKLADLTKELSNLSLRGSYRNLDELPLEEFDAFLFTSYWEGLPTTIIHVGARGLPVVASGVGGVGELIHADTGWLVGEVNDEAQYLDALRIIAKNKPEAARRSRLLQKFVAEHHGWDQFIAGLSKEMAFLR